jgi:paraquat-inducible protein A
MVPVAHARSEPPALTARRAGLVGCRGCGMVSPAGARACPRCHAPLHGRMPHSLQRVWAWLAVGLIAYVPANLLPMMVTTVTGRRLDSTILGGVVDLVHHGAYLIAGVVFLASVVIPVSKFFVIALLALSIQRRLPISVHARMRLYEAVEFIGRWSMVDVFVVAILTALIQMGFFASINPGPAAVFFAMSVAFTMLSAQAMDPRLIWDSAEAESAADARRPMPMPVPAPVPAPVPVTDAHD